MPKALYICLLLLATAMAAADPDALLKSSMEAHEAGNYAEAMSKLQQLDTVMGQSTPRVESLKVYSYVELKDWKNARIALTRYQQLARPGASSEAHQALLKLEPEIERNLAEVDKKWRQEKEQAEAAELKALADQDATERRTREASLRRSGATVARLEQAQRTAPPDQTEAEPALRPEEITDEQIASLVSAPDELFGWLDVHGADFASVQLADRLRQQLNATNLSEPLLRGGKILVGLARETPTRIFETFPVEALAEAAGRPVAHDLYTTAGRWVLRPLPWTLPATARAHYLIRDQPDEAAALVNRRAGHLLTGTVRGDGLWCASFVTLPLREARSDPWVKESNDDSVLVNHYRAFPESDLHMVLNSPFAKHRLVNLDWSNGMWITVVYPPSYSPNQKVSSQSPDFGYVLANSVGELLHELQTSKPIAVAKVVIGRDRCVALTAEGPAMALEWLLVDSLTDPALTLLLESGRKIHLLANAEAMPP